MKESWTADCLGLGTFFKGLNCWVQCRWVTVSGRVFEEAICQLLLAGFWLKSHIIYCLAGKIYLTKILVGCVLKSALQGGGLNSCWFYQLVDFNFSDVLLFPLLRTIDVGRQSKILWWNNYTTLLCKFILQFFHEVLVCWFTHGIKWNSARWRLISFCSLIAQI